MSILFFFPFYFLACIALIIIFPLNVHYCFILLSKYNWSLPDFSLILFVVLMFVLIKKGRLKKAIQWFYILFHELSHALFVLIFRGKIHEIVIQSDMGYVKTDKHYLLIRIAPYLFALSSYSILLVLHSLYFFFENINNYFWIIDGLKVMIVFLWVVTSYFNWKLILKETTDIDRRQVFLSFCIIVNSYLFTSTFLFIFTFMEIK